MRKAQTELLNTHFAVKEVKSSSTMFEVESLDRKSLNASSLISLIPSFSARQHWEGIAHRKHSLSPPKSTSNEGNRIFAVPSLRLPLDRSFVSKSGGVQR